MDRRRWIAAAAVAAVVLLPACDPADGGTPRPSATAGSPSPAGSERPSPSPTSTEVPIREQMRRDKEAVKQAYIASFDEVNRLDMTGGATKPTQVLLNTTSGEFRRGAMVALKQHKKSGIRLDEPGVLHGLALGGWTKKRMEVTACEDFSHTRWLDKSGEVAQDGDKVKYVQQTVAIKGKDGRWRIDGIETQVVDDFETASCNLGGV